MIQVVKKATKNWKWGSRVKQARQVHGGQAGPQRKIPVRMGAWKEVRGAWKELEGEGGDKH